MFLLSKSRSHVLICLLITGATFLAYHRIPGCGFIDVFDDRDYVLENPHVLGGLSFDSLIWAFTKVHAANWHPLTWLSHMLDVELFGTSPIGHHLSSLLLHIANAILLYLALSRMTGYVWRSVFVAFLFAIHPLHVESVAWVAERKDTLSTFFWMLVMLLYAVYGERERRSTALYLLITTAYALGLMAKPMLVSLPIVLLLLDWWPLERAKKRRWRNLIVEKIPLLVLAAASSITTLLVQQRAGAMGSYGHFPLGIRVGNAAVSYFRYIGRMFWPHDLAVFYPHPGKELPIWQAATAVLMLIVISAMAIRTAKRVPYLAAGWGWYLITLLPVTGLVQVGGQAMADRYTYVPLIGPFIAVTWILTDPLEKCRLITRNRAWNAMFLWERAGLKILAACAIVLALSILTNTQVGYWKDSISLFEHTVAVTPPNSTALVALGAAYAKRGRIDEAILRYKQAVMIDPNYAEAHNNLGMALSSAGLLDEAIEEYGIALRLEPRYADAQNNLGAALARLGRLQEAIPHFQAAVSLDPSISEAYSNLGSAYALLGRLDEAVRAFRRALEIEPDSGQIRTNLALALFHLGDYAGAERELRRAQESGGVPPPGFIEELSSSMHRPHKRRP